jgi:hypothetical protein
MRFIVSLLILDFCHSIAYCQNITGKFNLDSLTAIIKLLPECKEEQKHYDSLTKNCASCNFSITVSEASKSSIMSGFITELLDSVQRIVYVIKYDTKQKKIVSIEKTDKTIRLQ